MVLAMKALITLHGVSSHLIWPLEIWLILYLLLDLVYRLFEHYVNYLASSMPSMSNKTFPGLITIIPFWPKVSSVLGNYLFLPLSLLLILLHSFIFINLVH